MTHALISLLLVLPSLLTLPGGDADPVFAEYGVNGSFIVCPVESDSCTSIDADRCGERFIPASTFKILNSLIALETGAVNGTEEVLKWDGRRYAVESWNQDQDMEQAFQRSCVWFYQELARRIGDESMRGYLRQCAYGNMSTGGGIDRFWLDGDLRISQEEQIALLRKLWAETLPFRPEVQKTVKRLMVLEKTDAYTFYGKTGLAIDDSDKAVGWLVGFVEQDGRAWCYALNIEGRDTKDGTFRRARYDIAKRLLKRYHLLQ